MPKRKSDLALTGHEKGLAAEIKVQLRDRLKTPDGIRDTLCAMLARQITLTHRMMSLRDVDVTLLHATYRKRTSDLYLIAEIPGRNKVSFTKSKLKQHHICATCGSQIYPGADAYMPETRGATWVRARRVCYACAEMLAPLTVTVGDDEEEEIPDGREDVASEG